MTSATGIPKTMAAAVIREAGGPEKFTIEEWPVLTPQTNEVLIRIHAFGLNRSEMFTRKGLSPPSIVKFPRILGIEAVGRVAAAPGNETKFPVGAVVATAMGGMGRTFDGGYADYTCVPTNQVQLIQNRPSLPWSILGALPEMMQTVYGGLFTCLHLQKNDRLLIRGGTTSIGLAASAIAKHHGAFVASTTRDPTRKVLLTDYGADQVFIDNGSIAEEATRDGKFSKCLEVVGVSTLVDSLQCVSKGGTLCAVGAVCDKFDFDDPSFNPMASIPTAVNFTAYHSNIEAVVALPLDEIIDMVAEGKLKIPVGKVFDGIDKIVEAHRLMDSNQAGGKIVITLE